MTLTDCHCHPTDERFGADWAEVRERAVAAGVTRFVCGGVEPEEWDRQLKLTGVEHCFGLHPYFVAEHTAAACDAALQCLPDYLKQATLIGEIGIDKRPAYWSEDKGPRQVEYMEKQLDLAVRLQKVPVYHVVRGHDVLQPAIKARRGLRGGIVHAFVGNVQTARFYLDQGCYLSIGRHLLQEHAGLVEVVAFAPIDRLLVESDAPDGSAGDERNEPTQVIAIANAICALKKVEPSEFSGVLQRSVDRLVNPSF